MLRYSVAAHGAKALLRSLASLAQRFRKAGVEYKVPSLLITRPDVGGTSGGLQGTYNARGKYYMGCKTEGTGC